MDAPPPPPPSAGSNDGAKDGAKDGPKDTPRSPSSGGEPPQKQAKGVAAPPWRAYSDQTDLGGAGDCFYPCAGVACNEFKANPIVHEGITPTWRRSSEMRASCCCCGVGQS
eukprot:5985147-Pyramimonas_sp.AAC.1